MQTSQHLLDLVNYNEWANARIAKALNDVEHKRTSVDDGSVEVCAQKVVVDEVEDPLSEISLEEARELAGDEIEIGEGLLLPVNGQDIGRTVAPTAKQRQIFSHIVTTEQEYLERINGKDSTGFNFWPELSIEECDQLNTVNAARYRRCLGDGESGLDRVVNYKTSRGEPYSNTLRELITHVLIHSAIHRGNIIIKLREAGFEPPQTDNLIFLRETRG